MTKKDQYKAEFENLHEVFKEIDDKQRKLVNGLINDAAFLFAENWELKLLLEETGSVKVHPTNKTLQKPVIAAKEYRQNLNSYTSVIKTLNSILTVKDDDDDDDLSEYE